MAKQERSSCHDIIVVGASAGGVEALKTLAAGLPSDLPAALMVVLHVSPRSPSLLDAILARAGPLPAETPADGARIEKGRIYVASPDSHLLVARERWRIITRSAIRTGARTTRPRRGNWTTARTSSAGC